MSFRNQIEEDIRDYREQNPLVEELGRDEWAFNYWILDKFFHEDSEMILDKIIDYKDRGIDAYEWYEDTKELFLIQNKYYTTAKLQDEYVNNNFLITPIATLENGTYVRCAELQKIYSAFKNDDKFSIRLQIYVTNDLRSEKVEAAIREFNKENAPRITAEIYYLKDIEEKWYGTSKENTTQFTATIESVNRGTVLSINNAAYKLENIIDAKYVLTPVVCIYRMLKLAQEKNYPLFEKNIREYLGNSGVNKNIYRTLKDKNDRKNFFYYNNGITVICDEIGNMTPSKREDSRVGVAFTAKNPQIVNGCQTVNSIFSALSEYDESELEEQFKDSFVMIRVLQIDKADELQSSLARAIVTYNNSQNSIDEKTFVANGDLFRRLQEEFEKKGFLLLIKQSDKNTYTEKYKTQSSIVKLRSRSDKKRAVFGLESWKKPKDFMIPLEKLLQVILAFRESGHCAYTQKKDVLKPETRVYEMVVEFLRSDQITTEVLLDLFLLYQRAEKDKKANQDGGEITPIPFYVVDCYGKYECNEREKGLIHAGLDSAEKINQLMRIYKFVCKKYSKKFMQSQNIDYNKMIKMPVDYALMKEMLEDTREFL